jgi:hypothetical protein
MSDLIPSPRYPSHGMDLYHSEADSQEASVVGESVPRMRRTLIDYTVTNRPPMMCDSEDRKRCVGAESRAATERSVSNSPRRSPTQLNLPSFAALEKIPYGSMRSESDDQDDERIDFFLKISPRRSSENRISELRAGFVKSRSTKSRLFGSFNENGEIRKSYSDLKELYREKVRMERNAS